MSRRKTFGLFGNRKKNRHLSPGRATRHNTPRNGLRSLRMEPLEERRLLSLTTITGGDGSSWEIADHVITSNGLPTGGNGIMGANGSGVAIRDASVSGHGDAFDGAAMVWVNDIQVGGALSQTGNTVTFDQVNIADLDVQMRYEVLATSATLRSFVTFTNSTASDITVPVDYAGNFGSDSSTAVEGTSSGDTTFDTADRWLVTSDTVPSDAVNTSVLFGAGTPAVTPSSISQTVFSISGTEGVLANYSITVPAGQTRAMMFFQQLNDSVAGALTAATDFDSQMLNADLLVGLSPTDLEHTLNFDFYSSDQVIDADDLGGNGVDNATADDFRIVRNGADIEVWIDGNFSRAFPYALLNTITVNGSGDDDTLTVDYSGGNPIPFSGITFDAGAGFDSMAIVGGSANDITHEFINASDGVVNIDGSIINYTGLAPITDNLSATNRVFTFTGGSETITFTDGGGAGQSYIDSTLGENVTFTNPSASLTINTNGGAGPDTIDLWAPDAAFAATVTVNASANGDTVNVYATEGGTYTVNGGVGNDIFNIHGTTSPLTVNGFSGNDMVNILGTGGMVDVNGGDDSDMFNIQATGSAVTVNGGNDNDSFYVSSNAPSFSGDVNGIAGALNVNGQGGTDYLFVSDRGGGADAAGVLSGTQITGLGNSAAITYGTMESLFLELSNDAAGDTLTITNTHAGTTQVATGAGPDTVNVQATTGTGLTMVNTGSGDDTVNVSSDAPTNLGILDNIDGQLDVSTGDGIDTMNVSDFGDNVGDTYTLSLVGNVTELDFNDGFGGVEIRYDANGTPGQLEHFNLVGANDLTANNVYNINNTTATISNTISDGDVTLTGSGNDGTFNIQADAVQAGASNTFNGFDGNDEFNVNFRADLAIPVALGTTFEIRGGQLAADTDNRDVVRINTSLDTIAGRVLGITYASPASGDLDITGLGTPTFMDLNTVETLFYTGDAANDDAATVIGTVADDDLTVAPLNLSSALVFLGGNPWDGPSDAETFENALPGIAEADGSTGPDMLLNGLATNLFTVDGGGAGADGNQLYVYGSSEDDLVDPITQASADDLFGFGNGVVIPGLGLNNAFDEMLVTDAFVRMVTDADAAVPTDARIRVNIATSSFVQTDPLDIGLFVNSGSEAAPASSTPVDDIADDIRAALSYSFAMQINGGNPVPAFARDGDRLLFVAPGEINIYSDKSVPPIVTVTSTDPTTAMTSYGLGFSSIENMVLTPGPTSQTVNFLGDDNDPTIDQNDNYVVIGADVDTLLPALTGLPSILGVAFNPTASPIHPDFEPDPDGDNEFFLEINGSAPIGFRNVTQINGFGDDQNPPPGTPSVGPNDIDRIEVTPYADDTPEGWGIDVAFDEGNPDLDGTTMPDLVVYNGVAGVSEEIIIAPSGPGCGQLIVNNAATGTPIVVIDYTTNTGIRINGNDGSAGDTDVLTLRGTDGTTSGTSGNDTVMADFTAAGTGTDPIVSVSESYSGNILYELIDFSNIDTINFDLDDGDDTITILGRTNGAGIDMDNVNVYTGSGDDMLIVDNSNGMSDFTGGLFYEGAAGNDALQLIGSTAVDTSLYLPGPNADEGFIVHEIDGTTQRISFTGLEPIVDMVTAITLTVNGTNADNAIDYSPGSTAGGGLVSIDGFETIEFANKANLVINALGGNDVVTYNGTAAMDAITVTPTSVNSATMTDGVRTSVDVLAAESVAINGTGGNDTLNVTTPSSADTITYTPGDTVDSASVQVGSLIPLSFTNLGHSGVVTLADNGGTRVDSLIYKGTDADDVFNVTATSGDILLNNQLPVSTPGINALTLNGLEGDDRFAIAGDHPFVVVCIEGGDPDASDVIDFNGSGGDVTINLDLLTISESGYGSVSLSGVELARVDASGSDVYVLGTAADDNICYSPTGFDEGRLELTDLNTIFDLSNAGALTLNPVQGQDTVVVRGNESDNTINVVRGTNTNVAVDGLQSVDIVSANTEALLVTGEEGDDTITVSGSGGPALTIDGGQPTASDTLTIMNTNSGTTMVTPGATPDAGTVTTPDTAADTVFVGIETLALLGAASTDDLVVLGTDANDTIAAKNNGVWVNDRAPISFSDFDELVLAGQFGDDAFSITPMSGVAIIVDGGDPTASDSVTVNGTTGTDTITVSPMAADAATVEVNSLGVVTVGTVESLVINGLGGDDLLNVTTPSGADTITYTPGATVDSASVQVGSLIPLSFTNLGASGSVTLADNGGIRVDRLIYEGTDADDAFDVTATSGAILLKNSQLTVSTPGVDALTLNGFGGDDLAMIISPQPYGGILFKGGDPGSSDLMQIFGEAYVTDTVEVFPNNGLNGSGTVWFNSLPIGYSGLEDLQLLGNPVDNDSLLINGTLAENQWDVDRGSLLYGTRVQIDSREVIEYGEFTEIELRSAPISIGGADVFRVHPAYIGNLTVTGYGEDVLEIVGTGGDDQAEVNTTQAILASTAVTYSGITQLNVLTGSGDDMLTVNVDGTDLIGVPITFDGGEGSDVLTVAGTPLAGSAESTYRPGPAEGQGRLTHEDGTTTMTVDFLNLEPVVDLVPGPLLVLGTPAANTINYEQGTASNLGRVTVDNFELIEFSLKTSLTIDAMAGNDVINLDNAAQPIGLGSIIVRGRDGDDTITLANLPASVPTTVHGDSGNDLVDGSGVSTAALTLYGDAGDDMLIGGGANDTLSGGSGDDVMIGHSGDNAYDGGTGFDTIGIIGTLDNDRIDVNQTSASTLLSVVNGDTRNDTFTTVEAVRVELNRGDDIIRVTHDDSLVATPGASLRMEVLGDDSNASDRLAVVDDGLGDVVLYNKAADGHSGTITVGPLAPVVFEGIEYVDITPLNEITGGTGSDGLGRLVVFKPDSFENNNTLPMATYLGSGTTINVDPTVNPGGDTEFGLPGDSDWYQFVAAETGTLDFQVYFEEIATLANGRAGLPGDGNLDIEVYDVDGTLIAGNGPDFGTNDGGGDLNVDGDAFAEDERIRIPAVAGQTYYLRVFGHTDDAVNVYNMTVLNEAAPVPYDIELDDIPVGDDTLNDNPSNSDTGRSQFDNITRDNTPVIVFRLDDAQLLHDLPGNPSDDTPPDEVIPIGFNTDQTATTTTAGYRVAVFVEGDPQQPGQLPQTPVGYARQIVEGVYEFDFDTDALDPNFELTDGSHFISAKVQMIDPADPTEAGFGSRSVSLEIVVDTIVPPVCFGEDGVDNDGLHPDSDTGIEDQPDLFVDRITSDTTPSFWGIAEADAIVRVYADLDGDGVLDPSVDLFLGETVALPLDGTNQFPRGEWNFTTNIDMNDPAYFADIDGLRTIFVTAEDVAGNVSEPELLDIFIDTRGPQVNDVTVVDNTDYDLFDPKPSEDGPTPLVWSLDIDFIDEPIRVGESLIIGDDAVFVIDVSGSTSNSFGGTSVGDLNGDGSADTILDAEIAGFIALNQELIDRGLGGTSNISIVTFGSGASQLDMDPITAGVQLATTPSADLDGNGTPDVEDVLRSLSDGGSTNFEAALQSAINTINTVGTAPADGNVIFLSDGYPDSTGTYGDEVTTLQGMGHNLRAFGVGTGSSLSALQIIDPTATQFTTTDELLDVFGSGGGSSSGSSSVFIYPAVNEILATTPGNIQLVGDANGIIPIESIEFIDHTVAGGIGQTTIRLNFFEPLPDDRYTLTVSDRIKDDAGNALDGESNTAEPQETPLFPSGDGDPGEDFTARFTVDSRPELGVWAAGSVWVDTNGNFIFDPTNIDFTNRDITYTLAYTSDEVFAGNFAAGAREEADGFDKLAAYGKDIDGTYRWLIDTDNDGVPNLNVVDPANVNGYPVAGNFDGNSTNGDEVGLFTGSTWYLDTDHDFKVDTTITSAIVGHPIVGDFDGDGIDDLATWTDDTFSFDLAFDGFGNKNAEITEAFSVVAGFIGVRERPVAADMDQDGIDDIGLWVPDRAGATPEEGAEWYFLVSDDHSGQKRTTGTVNTLAHSFTPIPFGEDVYARFGDDYAMPIVGNFDPPVTGGQSDPSGATTPELSMTLVQTPTTTTDGTVATLPDSEAWIDEWSAHWVEIWASIPDGCIDDIVGSSFNLTYNTEYFTATDIEFGSAFNGSQTYNINDAAGVVEAISVTTTLDNVGDDGFVLLARVLFKSMPGDSGVMLDFSQEYITPVSDLGLGLTDGYVELDEGGLVTATLGDLPDTTLLPVIYDLDDDGCIGLGDFAHLASVFRWSTTGPDAGLASAADFDKSGIVNLDDFSFLAANFRFSQTTDTQILYPDNFPEAWYLAALTVDTSVAPQGLAELLTEDQLDPVVDAAASRLAQATGTETASLLDNMAIKIVDLPGDQLGQASADTIWIDRDAAGYGWFIDATPGDDAEFLRRTGTDELMASWDSAANGRVDLLTTLMHELGHAQGYEHSDNPYDLMYSSLSLGTRRLFDGELLLAEDEAENDDSPKQDSLNTEVCDDLFGLLGDTDLEA